jgi:hypothetical protein
VKTAGAPFLLEGKNPFGYSYQSGWGGRRGAALLRQFSPPPSERLQDQERAQSRPRLADLVRRRCIHYDQVAQDIGVSAMPRPRNPGDRRASLTRCRR